MRVSNRVTTTAMNRNFSKAVNDVHSKLNKSMNKISSGKAYENAAQNPLAYYEGKKMDNQYQETLNNISLLGDLQKRFEQQEIGAYSIQTTLAEAQKKVIYISNGTNNDGEFNIDTIRQDLLQKAQSMVNDLNIQYEDYYVFGGNDVSSAPFTLSEDGTTLTFKHKFPGDNQVTTIEMGLDSNGKFQIADDDLKKVVKAIKEQGRVDVGYGTIENRDTLLDTFTSGLTVLTGYSSDAVKAMTDDEAEKKIRERLENSPVFLVAQSAFACQQRIDGEMSEGDFASNMEAMIDKMTDTHALVGTVYSDLGTKYSTLENLDTKLKKQKQSLEEQYKDKLGADPYEAITEMFSYQYSYSAALQVGSRLMQSSLFDFIR